MKRILTLVLCLGLASAVAVEAKDKDKGGKKGRQAQAKVFKQQAKAAKQDAKFQRRVNRSGGRGNQARIENRNGNQSLRGRLNRTQRRNIDRAVAPNVARESRRGKRGRNFNRSITRRGPANFAWSFSEARQRHHRGVRRDRSWYRNNYNRFALFAGGYYYFDRGYWYPAYGYDRAYSTYRYDEPIYGYNSLDPRDVIVNVQSELRREGYYHGSIDGLLGPQTRRALERYQRDRGLYVTRSIDGPTLAALGLT